MVLPVEDDGPHPIAVADQQLAEHGRELAQHVLLGPSCRPECHRSRSVDEQPRRELAVLREIPHQQLVHPGRGVPVDMADVVAPLVGPQIEEIGAVAPQEGPVVALQAPVEPPDHLPVQATQDRLGRQEVGRVHGDSPGSAAGGTQDDVGDPDGAATPHR